MPRRGVGGTILAVDDYHGVVASLRQAYGPAAAAKRDGMEKEAFKVDERCRFLELLHVPAPELPRVLAAISGVLVPGGLCYAGTWGGADEEGPVQDDRYPVPRFFAFRSDQVMRQTLAEHFRVLSFATFDAAGNHFQSFMLEKPADPGSNAGTTSPTQANRRLCPVSLRAFFMLSGDHGPSASYIATYGPRS